MRHSVITAVLLAALTLSSLAARPVFAQGAPDPDAVNAPAPDQAQGQDPDPPGRVARISLTDGSVSLEPAGTQEWATADLNRPLTTGDKLWTDQNSRVELDIGSAAIRLGDTTGFSFLNLDDHTAQMQVTAGTVIVRVRSVDQGDNYEIDTPNLAVSLMQPGQYRVEVNDAGDTTVVAVAQGDAEAAGDGQGFPIHAQQKATFTGTQRLSSVIASLGAPDDFDAWSLSRDRQMQSAQSQEQQYVSSDATGYGDLDNNGRWEDTPDYGYVWTPTTVAVGWAPYRFGHWVWVAPWGWTWIDDAPWGFAPFHYGRWVTWRGSWCWVPGPRQVRPVYAPALVAWVGGPAVGVSVAAGVGWFPLAPREVYIPSYRTSPRYVQLVNVTNTVVNKTYVTSVYENRVTNITYVNRGVRGAVTTVPQSVFTSAQPVGRSVISSVDVRSWTARPVAPSIAPTRVSLVGAGLRANVRQPPPTIMSRQVVVKTRPPRAPAPFDRQVQAIRANGGRPLGGADLARLQPNTPAAPVRVVTPQRRGGFERPMPGNQPPQNQPSIADRERAMRGNGQFGSAENERPPVAPRQERPDRPPSAQDSFAPSRGEVPRDTRPSRPETQGGGEAQVRPQFPPRDQAQSRNETQPRNEAPTRPEFQSRPEFPPRPEFQQRPEFQPRTEPQPRNEFQPRNEAPQPAPRNEGQPRTVEPREPYQPRPQPQSQPPREPYQPRPQPQSQPPREPPRSQPAPAPRSEPAPRSQPPGRQPNANTQDR